MRLKIELWVPFTASIRWTSAPIHSVGFECLGSLIGAARRRILIPKPADILEVVMPAISEHRDLTGTPYPLPNYRSART